MDGISSRASSIFLQKHDDSWFQLLRYYAIKYGYFKMDTPHTHDEMEIMYISEGKCQIVLSTGVYCFREGEYIFIDGQVPHQLFVERGDNCRVLNLELRLLPMNGWMRYANLRHMPNYAHFFADKPAFWVGSDPDGILYAGIINLLRLMQKQADVREIDLQIALVLSELARQYTDATSRRSGGIPVYVKKAMQYIEANFDKEEISVCAVADYAKISRSHLQRSFRQYYGCSIVQQINALRMKKAKYLLDTGTIPVIDIAMSVGLNSRQHFSSLFVKMVGCTPTEYRKQKIGGNISTHHFEYQ